MTRPLSTLLLATVTFGVAAVSAQAAVRGVVLIDAVKNGDVSAVRALIAQKADVNATEPDGTTALHWAAHLGDGALAEVLVQAGANINAATRNGATPYALALNKGNTKVIEVLLKASEDPHAILDGAPAIMMAARAGNADAVKALLVAGADPNVAEPERDQTALMWAAARGNTAVVKVLLEAGANINARSKAPNAPTRIPCLRIGRGLRTRQSDPLGVRADQDLSWSENTNGLEFTPIMWAAREGDLETVQTLLDAGANVNDEKPGDGTTVLLLAILNRHYELGSYLLDRGADPNRGPGYTALHQIAWTRRLNGKFGPLNPEPTGSVDGLDLAKKIIDKGVQINAQATKSFGDCYRNRFNRVGATAFLMSAKLADVPMMKLLVERGADLHITNQDEDTPLMVAAGVGLFSPGGEDAGTEEEVLAAVKYLVEELKIPVNAQNKNRETALHGVCYRGYNSVGRYLLDHGAGESLDATNLIGWKPITVCDGQFYNTTYKAQPQTAALLRDYYRKLGRVAPEEPKVNDTSGLTLDSKFTVGQIVRPGSGGYGYDLALDAEVAAGVPGLVRVVAVNAQGQIVATEPYVKR